MAEVYETLAPEAAFPGLVQGRGIVGMWLTIELAKHHSVPLATIDDVFNRLPTNYANMLDTAEGVNLLSIIVGEALGQSDVEPFYRRLQ